MGLGVRVRVRLRMRVNRSHTFASLKITDRIPIDVGVGQQQRTFPGWGEDEDLG